MTAFLESALRRALKNESLRLLRVTGLTGGCIHEARRLETSEGDFFAKWSASCPPDIFLREAEGLETLHGATCELLVPRVIAASVPLDQAPAFLILEYLKPASSGSAQDDERLGRGLAAIHATPSDRFGFASASYCGSTRQNNGWRETWPEFYRDCRLRPLISALAERGHISAEDRRIYDRVMDRFEILLPRSQPSLIHGDLWSGNILWCDHGPALVDPACAYADREMEFGIVTLFGGLSERALRAYEEASPLEPGWRDRNPLYQLYHLLNHALLFGGSYAEDARRIALRYVD